MRVRRSGAAGHPWEARCSRCRNEQVHFASLRVDVPGGTQELNYGAVVVNTRGMGNRTWWLAMLAAKEHLLMHAKRGDVA